MNKLPVWAIARLRMGTDGNGVTTLVTSEGCPLRCKYCINPHSWNGIAKAELLSAQELYEKVRIDDLYFQATGGGVTFGGGEPLLYSSFFSDFRELCGEKWKLSVETSLNVPSENISVAANVFDTFIIDVKDMNPDIYRKYTGSDNSPVMRNLQLLIDHHEPESITIRIPQIPGYNTKNDVENSVTRLQHLGFKRFDIFPYRVPE